jgi:hypothetical protein
VRFFTARARWERDLRNGDGWRTASSVDGIVSIIVDKAWRDIAGHQHRPAPCAELLSGVWDGIKT